MPAPPPVTIATLPSGAYTLLFSSRLLERVNDQKAFGSNNSSASCHRMEGNDKKGGGVSIEKESFFVTALSSRMSARGAVGCAVSTFRNRQ